MRIDLRGVSFSYRRRHEESRQALTGVNLTLHNGECLGIIGAEGAGKSTLLHIMGALQKPDTGSMMYDGNDLWKAPKILPMWRRVVGISFQFPEQQFISETVEAEMLLRVDSQGNPVGISTAADALRMLGLPSEQYLPRSPFSLSMGEARRVALASLFLVRPRVLLLDEPTAGLDGNGVNHVLASLKSQKERGTTIVVVSHDLDLLAQLVTRVVVLEEGYIRIDANAGDLLTDAERLLSFGYDLPEIVRIAEHLHTEGRVPERRLYAVDELRRILRSGRNPSLQ